MTTPFILCATITAISAMISFGYSVAAVFSSSGQQRTMALYTCARSIAFVVVSAVPLLTGSLQWLEAAAVGMVIVQACDAAVGVILMDKVKMFGPAGTAIANLAALVWLISK